MKYIKIIIIIISIINSAKIFSHNNCNGAIQLDSFNIERKYYINNSEYWLQFKADSVNFSLILNPCTDINSAEVSTINFYQGDCNNLTQLKTINVLEGDSAFALTLTIGEIYYIQVINNLNIGGYFSLNCSNQTKSNVNLQCGILSLCNINPNINFNDLSSDLIAALNGSVPNPNLILDPMRTGLYSDVCNWRAYTNSPQIFKEINGNFYLYMWAHNYFGGAYQESAYNVLKGNTVPGGIGIFQSHSYSLSFKYREHGNSGVAGLKVFLDNQNPLGGLTNNPQQQILDLPLNTAANTQNFVNYDFTFTAIDDFDAILIYPYQLAGSPVVYGGIDIDDFIVTEIIFLPIDLSWGKPCEMMANFTFSMPNTPNITYTWHLPNNAVITNYYAANNIWVNWNNAGLATITLEGRDPNGCLIYYGSYTLNYDNNCVPNAISYNSLKSSQIIALNNSSSTLSNSNQIRFTGTTVIDEDLWISNCPNIFMASNAKIVVMPGKTLHISGSTLQGCTCPWDGIFAENSTASVIISNSTIRDAKNAIVSSNRGYFNIITSNFINNKIGLWVRRYNPEWIPDGIGGYIAPPEHNGYIASSTFTKNTGISGFYSGVYDGLTGIVVDTVYKLTIGDFNTASYTNHFSNLQYGVKIKKSDVSIFNNSFSNIVLNSTLPHPIYQTVNSYVEPYESAIYSIMDNEVNPPYMPLKSILNVGGLNYKSNSFENCNVGVYGRNCKAVIDNNNFTNQNYIGVHLKDFVVNTQVQYNSISMTSNLLASNHLYNSSLLAEQTLSTNVKLDINYNTINNSRTGIKIRNCNGVAAQNSYFVNVLENTVNFESIGSSSNPFIGIDVSSASYANIESNIIQYNPMFTPDYSTTYNLLRGISVASVQNAKVSKNNLIRMGTGIWGADNLLETQFFCNDLDKNYYGFHFLPGATQISDQKSGSSGGRLQASDNYWYDDNINFTTPEMRRIGGEITNNLRYWYHRGNNNDISNIFSPYILVPPVYHPVYPYIRSKQNIAANSDCSIQIAPISTGMDRAETFGDIVNDSIVYAAYQSENKYYAEDFAYQSFDDTPALLNLGVAEDSIYQQFYNDKKITGIGKFTDIDKYIINKQYSNALFLNNTVIPANAIESNKKTLNQIYLQNIINNQIISTTDSITLYNIANQLPFLGGEAVYSARVILGLDPADLNLDYVKNTDVTHSNMVYSDKVKVYPNPANEQINLAFENELSMEAEFELYDFSGKLLLRKTIEAKTVFNTINLKRVRAGIYYYKINTANETLANNKLVILNK